MQKLIKAARDCEEKEREREGRNDDVEITRRRQKIFLARNILRTLPKKKKKKKETERVRDARAGNNWPLYSANDSVKRTGRLIRLIEIRRIQRWRASLANALLGHVASVIDGWAGKICRRDEEKRRQLARLVDKSMPTWPALRWNYFQAAARRAEKNDARSRCLLSGSLVATRPR